MRLAKGEWIHASLVTPKSSNFNVGLDEACKKYITTLRDSIKKCLNVIKEVSENENSGLEGISGLSSNYNISEEEEEFHQESDPFANDNSSSNESEDLSENGNEINDNSNTDDQIIMGSVSPSLSSPGLSPGHEISPASSPGRRSVSYSVHSNMGASRRMSVIKNSKLKFRSSLESKVKTLKKLGGNVDGIFKCTVKGVKGVFAVKIH